MVDGLLICAYELTHPSHGNFVQSNALDRRPDDRQATGLCREHINLVGALPHIAEQTFNSIGGRHLAI